MVDGVFNLSFDFWQNWLFGSSYNATESLLHLDGTLINIDITQLALVNIMSIITVILCLFIAYTLIRWFVKGVLSFI